MPAEIVIETPDGARLVGSLFEPDGEPAAALVLHGATAVPTKIYTAFASELAARGFATLVSDWRGTGRSASARRRDDGHVRMRDWIDRDADAATAWLGDRLPGVPLLALGHSVGGHAIALGAGAGRIDAAVIIATHLASSRLIPDARERRRVRFVLEALGPASAALLGYTPGRRLGLGEDLPAATIREWGGWTKLPDYFFDDPTLGARERAARYTTPTLYVGLDDDPWATPRSMDAFVAHLPNAPIERLQLAPAPGTTVGHLGFFKPANRETLWPPVLDWLGARAGASAPTAE